MYLKFRGDGGIRTPGRFEAPADFKSAAINQLYHISKFVVPAGGVGPPFWDFQSRPFPRLDTLAFSMGGGT